MIGLDLILSAQFEIIWTITVITRVSTRGAHLFWILKRGALIPGRRSFEEGDH